jgi:uncharacterized protein (DUF4415 family)
MKTTTGKISERTRKLYEEEMKKGIDYGDAPPLPPEMWENAVVGKFYRPIKTAITVRIDNDVLAWLKSKGEGYQTRINAILRERMQAEQKRNVTPTA